jgi:hypothetical protein
MSRWLVGPTCDIQDVGNDSFVVPTGGKLGLAWLANSMPVTATSLVTVEYVRPPLGADIDVLHLRPVRGIDRIPPRTIRIGRPAAVISRLAVRGRPKHLVVLRATARLGRLGRLGPRARNVASRTFPLRRAEVIVRPV